MPESTRALVAGWAAALGSAVVVRVWNALAGPLGHGYDAWGHISYVLFLDTFRALPWADQGWSYFHPPLHYLFGLAFAQLGSADALLRGLALLGNFESLAIALLAAWSVRRGLRSGPLALAIFVAVAFLPVHLYAASMPGNEFTAAFFASACIASFLAGEAGDRQAHPALGDARTGALAGLALLSKFSAATVLLALAAVALRRAWSRGSDARRALRSRLLLAGAVALVVAGPWYARGWIEFGTPMKTSHDQPQVARAEAEQIPGERDLGDFVRPLGPSLASDSSWDSPHVLRSVWGSLYLNVWFDTYRASQLPRWSQPYAVDFPIHRLTLAFAALGLVPTLVLLAGALRAARRALRDPEAVFDATAVAVAGLGMASFAWFAWRVPTFAAVKASYLLQLSLPAAWFVARGLEVAPRALGRFAVVAIVAAAASSAAIFSSGLVLPAGVHHSDLQALRAHFGDAQSARDWFRAPHLADKRWAIEQMAAIELADGQPARARALLRSVAGGAQSAGFGNAVAVASALAGHPDEARAILDRVIAHEPMPEALANRAALRARAGDPVGARADLERALALEPELDAARRSLARLSGSAVPLEARAPRGFPHGVGDGAPLYPRGGQRWLLEAGDDGLSLYRPERVRARGLQP